MYLQDNNNLMGKVLRLLIIQGPHNKIQLYKWDNFQLQCYQLLPGMFREDIVKDRLYLQDNSFQLDMYQS